MKLRISVLSFFILVITQPNIYSQNKLVTFSENYQSAFWTGISCHIDMAADDCYPSNSLKNRLNDSDLNWGTGNFSGAIGFRVNRFGLRIEGLSGSSASEYNTTSSGTNYTGPIAKENRRHSMLLGSFDLLNINEVRCIIYGGKGAFKSEITNKAKDHSTTIQLNDYAYGYEVSYDYWMDIKYSPNDSIPIWRGPTIVQESYFIDSKPKLTRAMLSIGYSIGAANSLKISLLCGVSIFKVDGHFTSRGLLLSLRFNR
ncbi:MAG: hypothetical protein GY839_18285 [candidate division Zixibacteria bacterium]|nr:hypothetical protein [candidate division Zixibacteria bacterium]